eukprot:m.58475 g.58475  ORF g.58475 m.58475 type:complete len:233 (+) comp34816_c0_seq2:79-777(+)
MAENCDPAGVSAPKELLSQSLSQTDFSKVSQIILPLFEEREPEENEAKASKEESGVGCRAWLYPWEIFALMLSELSHAKLDKMDMDAIKKEEEKSQRCQKLAEFLCKHQIEVITAAQSAYLAGCKTTGYELIRLFSQDQQGTDVDIEDVIRKNFPLPRSLNDIGYEQLLLMTTSNQQYCSSQCSSVVWENILKKLNVDVSSSQTVCDALLERNVSIADLRDALCENGHFRAV